MNNMKGKGKRRRENIKKKQTAKDNEKSWKRWSREERIGKAVEKYEKESRRRGKKWKIKKK